MTNGPASHIAQRTWSSRAWLLVLFAGLLSLRLGAALHWPYTLDPDEAVVGVMALHIKAGLSFPVFFYGQSYMGTLEPFSVAAFMALFGEHAIALRLVPAIYFLLTVGVCGLIVRRHLRDGSVALLLVFLLAPTAFSVIWTMKARGGYIEGLLLVFLYVLLLLEYRRQAGRALGLALGVVSGFSVYTNPVLLPALLAPTLVAWLDAGRPGRFRPATWIPVAGGLLLGLAPLLGHRLLVEGPHRLPGGLSGSLPLERLDLLFLHLLPLAGGHLLGALPAAGVDGASLGRASTRIAEMVLLGANVIAFGAVTWAARREYWDIVRLRRRQYASWDYLLVILPAVVAMLMFSLIRDLYAVRYLITAAVLLAFYQMAFFRMLATRSRPLAHAFAVLVVISGVVANQHFLRDPDDRFYTPTVRVLTDHGEDVRPVVDFLLDKGLTHGYADQVLQWKLVFLSREALVYSQLGAERYPPYRDAVVAHPHPTYVLPEDRVTDVPGRRGELTATHGTAYTVTPVGRFLVFHAAGEGAPEG